MKTPPSRPRISSGAAACRMAVRNTADTMSASPARARQSTASHSTSARPNRVMAAPHTTMAASTATPCRCTRPSQPENSAPSSAPTASEE